MDTQLKLLRPDAPSPQDPIKHLKANVDPSTLHHRRSSTARWQRDPA